MFKCKKCQHIVPSEAAGEMTTPTACPACGAGIEFTARGAKIFHPENWEILAPHTPFETKWVDGKPTHTPIVEVKESIVGEHKIVNLSDTILTEDKI